MKTFKFGETEKCCFSVGHYNQEDAIAINVVEEETGEYIATLTVLDRSYDYEVGLATVCNDYVSGNDVTGYKTGTQVLEELGIIDEIWTIYELSDDGENSISVASCSLNLSVLKEYSREWEYWGR